MSVVEVTLLTACLLNVLPVSRSFNIDILTPGVFEGNSTQQFGHRVIQHARGTEKWIVVSAPHQEVIPGLRSGGIFRCDYGNTSCRPIDIPVEHNSGSIGLSLAVQNESPFSLTTCSPTMAHKCNSNMHLNGICYLFNNKLEMTSKLTPAFQECTKRNVDLVFLFDGSESLKGNDFNINKNFIVDIMKNLTNSSLQFAAVQFSSDVRTEFTFKDYQELKDPEALLSKSQHMKSLTNTYKALNFTLKTLLYNSTAGAIENAAKVLVIITDGNPTDYEVWFGDVVGELDQKNIIRYVIGIGNLQLDGLKKLASQPKDKNTFYIQNYAGLKGILDNLQGKIYSIEGSGNDRSFVKELSQSGFSATFSKDSLILGAVGFNYWMGAIIQVEPSQREKIHISPSQLSNDSYLGYSVTTGSLGNRTLYIAGAPRHNHKGRVEVFQSTATRGQWSQKQSIDGEQIGSYFGGEVCAVDLNGDGDTDILLVGAPLYHKQELGGLVYTYTLSAEGSFSPAVTLSGSPGFPLSRFGTAVSAVGDLDGDRLTDIAVGAPLENMGSGGLYIFQGLQSGVNPNYTQHITGWTMSPRLQYFGQSIHGVMDMNGDELTDIAVGSLGRVVLLRSRPVLDVAAEISFHPSEISMDLFDCLAKETRIHTVSDMSVCIKVSKLTRDSLETHLNLSYQIELDSLRQRFRADFGDEKRTMQTSIYLPLGKTCMTYPIKMKNCVEDNFSPIKIKMSLSQIEENSTDHRVTPILNRMSKTITLAEIPFEKNCGRNGVCISDLDVAFNFSGSSSVVVGNNARLNVTVMLQNRGDSSYNTTLLFLYPDGLSFAKMVLLQSNRRTQASCYGLNVETVGQTTCSVSPPIFPGKTTAVFLNTFDVSSDREWNHTLEMTVRASSGNGNASAGNLSVTLHIPVQFSVNVIVKGVDSSTHYLNFSTEQTAVQDMKHSYKVANLARKALPVNVTFLFPVENSHNFIWHINKTVNISEKLVRCSWVPAENSVPRNREQYCPNMQCKVCHCEIPSLEKDSSINFGFEGPAEFKADLNRKTLGISGEIIKVESYSSAFISYNTELYVQAGSKKQEDGIYSEFHNATIKTEAEFMRHPNMAFVIALSCGGGFLFVFIIAFIMYKIGCFKNKYKDMMAEEVKTDCPEGGASTSEPLCEEEKKGEKEE
ncbi:integrin alpha-D [Acipenser ruthenus]|uniref:integrin alpha-D n=1 Tax=Acipenser ruthenus TaxID=7906 RepID=UPI0027428682|nr:integrin alpha-D [Acipenser ruthenus]